MHEEPAYATFPPTPFANVPPTPPDLLPNTSVQNHSTVDFDALKRQFEATTISGPGDKKQQPQRLAHGLNNGFQQQSSAPQQNLQAMGGYQDVYGNGSVSTFAMPGLTMYGAFGAGAPPFIPQAQQQQALGASAATNGHSQSPSQQASSHGGYSGANSPYLGVGSPNPNSVAFGSPSSQSNGALPSLPGQSYASSFTGGYDTMPSSPNPYAANPYAFGGLGFGNQPFLGMMPGLMGMGMGSPQMGNSMQMQQQMQQNMGMGMGMGFPMQFPMMNSSMGNANQGPRTVYVGNLPSDASVDELLSQVRFGPIDSVKILPEKSCAFISFLDGTTAAAFHSDALMRKVRLHDQDLKIGWGKPSAVPPAILMAVQQSGATRNVYLGNLDESVTEQTLRDDLSRFGPIDQVKIVRDKNIGFVHFLSISTAIKVVQTLATEPEWAGRRVNYGKDRCAYVPKNQHQQQQHNMAAAAMGSMAANYGGFGGLNGFPSPNGFGGFGGDMNMGMMGGGDPNSQPGNRTVYLGNIHPETTTEEICNTIRGGILQQIRYIPDKHICFVTFVDAQCALAFYQSASYQGIALHNRRLKVGWGKSSGPTSPGIAMVVQSGGSRNVYIGNIEDFETFSEENLRHDFGEYGELELVNLLPSKNCAFCNFTNIANAIKAIEGMKSNKDYQGLKISFGKDRCGGLCCLAEPPAYTTNVSSTGAPRAFRGVDLFNQQNTFSRASYPDVYPESNIEAFDPTASDFDTDALPGAGSLVLDESVASDDKKSF
ncbi:hypothetical protein P7C70_g768, partial [Phenoliferia sp. Uapishka_3]